MKKNRKRIRNVLSVMVMLLAFGSVAYASGGEPALVSGTKRLLSDVITWLIGLEVVITSVLAIWRGIEWQKADEQEKPRKKKSFMGVIIIGVMIITVTTLVPFIFSYYK